MSSTSSTVNEMVAAVKAHAAAHYEESGWSYIVESYDDSEIAEAIAEGCSSPDEAIALWAQIVAIHADRRDEARAYGDADADADANDRDTIGF